MLGCTVHGRNVFLPPLHTVVLRSVGLIVQILRLLVQDDRLNTHGFNKDCKMNKPTAMKRTRETALSDRERLIEGKDFRI